MLVAMCQAILLVIVLSILAQQVQPVGAYPLDGGSSPPSVLSKVEAGYPEEARSAKLQGTVMLSLAVNDQGRPESIKVLRSLGPGLDGKAIEAVAQWRFIPGMKDGKPVPVMATIEVNFRLPNELDSSGQRNTPLTVAQIKTPQVRFRYILNTLQKHAETRCKG
jgi:TonB family protein